MPYNRTANRRTESPPEAYGYTLADLERKMRNADKLAQAGDVQAKKDAKRIKAEILAKKYDEVSNDMVSFLQGVGQSTTLGTSDEGMAAVAAGIQSLFGPGEGDVGTGNADYQLGQFNEGAMRRPDINRPDRNWFDKYLENYKTALGSTREDIATARQEDPWLTFSGELAGGMLTGGTAGAKAVAGKAVTPGLWSLAKTGGKYGTMAGYGYSEGDFLLAAAEQRMNPDDPAAMQNLWREGTEAVSDTAIGAGAGILGGSLFGGLASLGRAGGRKIATMAPAIKNKLMTENARREMAELITQDLAEKNLTPAEAQRIIDGMPGMTIADLGDNMRTLVEKMGKSGTRGGTDVAKWLRGRNIDQWKRMHPRLAEALTGGTDDNFYLARKKILEDIQTKSAEAYDAAYQLPVRINQPMLDIMRNPQMRNALKYANELREAKGKSKFTLDDFNTGVMRSTEEVDELIRGMDEVVGKKFAKGKGNVGEVLKGLRNEFRELIYKQNPQFEAARKTYGNEKLRDEALDKGLRIFNDDADLVEMTLQGMSKSEQDAFKIGTLQAIMRKLGNKTDTSNLSADLWSKENSRAALRHAWGSKRGFDDFMKYIEGEQEMYETFRTAVGNSNTAKYLAQQRLAEAEGGSLAYAISYLGAMNFMPTLPMGLAGATGRAGYEALAGKNPAQIEAIHRHSQNVAKMLQGRNVQDMLTPKTLGGLLDIGVPKSAGAIPPGLLATGAIHNSEDYGGY